MTLIVASIAAGALLGLGVGWKLGRGFERMRPTKSQKAKPKERRDR